MIIPVTELPEDTLLRIVEDYVTRDGTDYGEVELSLEQKSESLLKRIRTGEVLITFDEATESINLMSKQDYLHNNALSNNAPSSSALDDTPDRNTLYGNNADSEFEVGEP